MPKLDGLWSHTCHLKDKTKYGYVFIQQSQENTVSCKGAFYSESTKKGLRDIPELRWSGTGKLTRNKLLLTYVNEIDRGSCVLRIVDGSNLEGIWNSSRRKDNGIESYTKVHGINFIAPFDPIFKARAIQDDHMAFIIMPFAKKYDRVYRNLKSIMESIDLHCVRADEIFGPSAIINDIWRSILSAWVVIAELSEHNPNVYYELGLAHCLGKEVILLANNVKDIPFDLRHMRVVIYRSMKTLKENLLNTMNAMHLV